MRSRTLALAAVTLATSLAFAGDDGAEKAKIDAPVRDFKLKDVMQERRRRPALCSNQRVPANDGGISLGQAAIAACKAGL